MAGGTELAKAYVQIIPTTEGMSGRLADLLGGEAGSAGTSAGKSFGVTFTTAASAAIDAATSAVGVFAKSSLDAGMSFDSAISQVAATMGVAVADIEELRGFAMDMGASTAFSATEAAEALNYMALAGYDAETSMAMLPNVLDLAAAGGIGLASASDMITDAQSALGLSLEETSVMVDQMAKTASKSNTSVAQLGEAILTVGGTASYMAGGTEQIAEVLGVLADNGIKGSEAGTHLRNMLLSLSAPTKDARELLAALGVEIFDDQGLMRDFSEVFPELSEAMAGMTDQQKLDAFSTIFNSRDIASATALLSTTTERWQELGEAIVDSKDAAQAMAETQLDNLAGDVTLFKSALEGAQIAVSDELTPTLRDFVQLGSDGLSEITTAFREEGLGGAMEALGGFISDAIGMIIGLLPDFIEAGTHLLGALAQGMIDSLPALAEGAVQIVSSLAAGLGEALPELIPAVVGVVIQIVETLTDPDTLSSLVDASIAIILGLVDGLNQAMPELMRAVPQIVQNLVTAFVDNAPKIVEASLELIMALAFGLIESIPELLTQTPQIIMAIIKGLIEGIDDIKGVGEQLMTALGEGIMKRFRWLKEQVVGLFDGLIGTVLSLLGINSPSTVFADIGENMALGLGKGFNSTMEDVEDDIDSRLSFGVRTLRAESALYGDGAAAAYRGGDTFQITIDAANVREFNDIIEMTNNRRRLGRMGAIPE